MFTFIAVIWDAINLWRLRRSQFVVELADRRVSSDVYIMAETRSPWIRMADRGFQGQILMKLERFNIKPSLFQRLLGALQ